MSSNEISENESKMIWSLPEYIAYIEKSYNNNESVKSRIATLALPIYEAHAAVFHLAAAVMRIPGCCFKLLVGASLGPNNTDTAETNSKVALYEGLPGVTDLIILVSKAAFCTLGIVISPILGLIRPDLVIKIHHFAGFIFKKVVGIPQKDETAKGFEGIVGMDDLKKKMTSVISMLQEPKLAKLYQLEMPNGILLNGPAGCGKTFFAKKFTEELEKQLGKIVLFEEISASKTNSIWVSRTAQHVKESFEKAEESAKKNESMSVVFIDEIDTIIPKERPHDDKSGHSNSTELESIRGEYLKQLDSAGSKRIIVIGTTNRELKELSATLTRPGRFDTKFHISYPDEKMRLDLLQRFFKKAPCDKNLNLQGLAKKIEKHSVSDIKLKVTQACLQAFEKTREARKSDDKAEPVNINDDILKSAFNVDVL